MSRAVGQLKPDDGRGTKDTARRLGAALRPLSFAIGRSRDVTLALAAALLAVLLLAVGFNRAWPLTLDVGTQDDRFVAGFNAPQVLDGHPARWTTEAATIALPRPPLGTSVLAELRMSSGRPADQPDAHVTLDADGAPLGSFDVVRIVDGTRRYRALIAPSERLSWALRLDLQSTTFSLPNDTRLLGAVVDQVTLTPLASGPLVPSLWLLLWSAALGLLGYALPRIAGLRLHERWGGWNREPFTASSSLHVSVYGR